MKRIFCVLVLVIFGSSGCSSSLNGVVSDRTNLRSGEPTEYYQNHHNTTRANVSSTSNDRSNRYSDPASLIAEGTVQDIELNYHQGGFSRVYPDSNFDASFTPTSDGAQITMAWTSPVAMFPAGEYYLAAKSTQALNKREGLAFTHLVAQAISNMTIRMKNAGMDNKYHIVATYEGQADGTPIHRTLRYRNEYGTVIMTADKTTLNGVPHEFKILPGQAITNEELAALRTFSLMAFLQGKIENGSQVDDKFAVTTVNERGSRYRTAKVTITIAD
jgi:hypothetical protein